MKSKFITLLLLVLLAKFSYAQPYLLRNEQEIFSFSTANGKRVVLAKDRSDAYIIYRFGTKSKVEFEFPAKTKESWKQFKYSFDIRGGGTMNEGLDLNYIYFENKGYQYVIYDNYIAADKRSYVGIYVINLKNNHTTDIKGLYSTRKGTMSDFRDNGLLQIGDQIFD